MTTFVLVHEIRQDDKSRPALLNLDHVFLLIPDTDGLSTWVRPVSDERPAFSIRERPDEIMSGQVPRIPQYGSPPTPSQLLRWTDQLAQKGQEVQECRHQNETNILLNLEMARRLLET